MMVSFDIYDILTRLTLSFFGMFSLYFVSSGLIKIMSDINKNINVLNLIFSCILFLCNLFLMIIELQTERSYRTSLILTITFSIGSIFFSYKIGKFKKEDN